MMLSRSIIRLAPTFRHKSRKSFNTSAQCTGQVWQQAVKDLDRKQVHFYHTEKLIKVDDHDRVLGPISKGESHAIETIRKGVYHRALSLIIFDETGKFLLTQRASCKITFPGYFTNACCSHPLYEVSELEDDGNAIGVKRAAIRRSIFELGLQKDDIKPEEMKFVNKLAYKAESDGGLWGEAEIDYILILRKNLNLNLNPEEVSGYRYVSKSEMQELLKDGLNKNFKITPWMRLLARDYLFLYWDNLDNLDKIAMPHSIVRYDDSPPDS